MSDKRNCSTCKYQTADEDCLRCTSVNSTYNNWVPKSPPPVPDDILQILDHASAERKKLSNDLVYRTIKWNRDRGLLEPFDPDLEVRLLTEEANEFFHAESLVERLDAFADFDFVWEGTQAKFGAMTTSVLEVLVKRTAEFQNLQAWRAVVFDLMFRQLTDELAPYADPDDVAAEVSNLLIDVYEIVVEANELKGSVLVNGKIIKGPQWVNPELRIEKLLNDWIEERTEG